MWDLAVREKDFEGIDAMLARYRGRSPLSMRLLPAAARSDTALLRQLLDEGRSLESRQLQIAARYAASYLEDFGLAETLTTLDVQWRQRPANRAGAQLLRAGLAAARGQWSVARSAFRAAETMEGAGPVIVQEALVATLPLQPVSTEDLRSIRNAVDRWNPSPEPTVPELAAALYPHLRLYFLGLLSSRLGDWDVALHYASSIDSLPAPGAGRLVAGSLAATVRADVASAQSRHQDVLRELERVDSRIPLELISQSRVAHVREFGFEHARFLRAVSLAATGRPEEALTWLRFGLRGSPQEYLYHGPVHIRLGELFESFGQTDSAGAHYRMFLELWSRADAAAAPAVEGTRRRLEAVTRSRPR
jgi:tetratricopeptide (TPR) repeat protein